MLESILHMTALPNLHPLLVHFPIALLPTALLLDAAGLVRFEQKWLRHAAATLLGLAAVGAALSVWAGRQAADSLGLVPATVQPHIGRHSDWAHWALYAVLALAVLRLWVEFSPKLSEKKLPLAILFVAGLGTMVLMAKAADLGGALVYTHGVAVTPTASATAAVSPPSAAPVATDSEEIPNQIVSEPSGRLVWRPSIWNGPAEGIRIESSSEQPAPFQWTSAADGESGLTVTVDGTGLVLLPGEFGDVQVEAILELVEFNGSVALVHHVNDKGRGEFVISNEGVAELVAVKGDRRTVLDRRLEVALPSRLAFAVNSAGTHLKGYIDGATITHGHIGRPADGGCGLLLDGTGQVTIVELSVTPIDTD